MASANVAFVHLPSSASTFRDRMSSPRVSSRNSSWLSVSPYWPSTLASISSRCASSGAAAIVDSACTQTSVPPRQKTAAKARPAAVSGTTSP
jgi:hypothetical protein